MSATEIVALPGTVAATGHTIGATYVSECHGLAYTVEAVTTLWEMAPAGAVVVLWQNGNRTITDAPVGNDRLLEPVECVAS